MVGIVIVSHSAKLADGVVELARQMAGPDVAIVAAGGMDQPDRPLGTDAALILQAIEQAWTQDGVLVLMDLGSAVLSAEMAVELLPDEQQARVLLCEAPVVEGAVAAAVAARLGEPLARVADEARGGLAGKAAHLGAGDHRGAADVGTAEPMPAAEGETLQERITVTNPLGLHARPAARFVQTVGEFDATVTAENLTVPAGPASARSLNGVATLGVRQGHEVLVRASGPQAAQVLAALRELAGRNFDEPAVGAAVPATVATADVAGATPPEAGSVLHGIPGSGGIAIGEARHLREAVIVVPRDLAADPAAEQARLDAAVEAVRRQTRAARDSVAGRTGSGYDAGIFDAHLLFLSDEALLDPAGRLIAEGRNAADAWDSAVTDAAHAFEQLADPYQRERAKDLDSIRVQVLGELLGAAASGAEAAGPELAGPGIVVADELTPAQTAGFDPEVVLGIATAYGGPTSHAAILARALRIPAVLGLGPGVLAIPDSTLLLLDGDSGSVQLAPDEAELTAARHARRASQQAADRAGELASEPAVTLDGTTVEVAANAGSVADVRRAVAAGADGIGLLRTEFLFLSAERMPSEEEQAAVYAEIAGILAGRPLIVRTLDVGADKPLPYLPREDEPNPQLGRRGIRLGLARPDVLLAQVRAVLRVAAAHPVRLMFPMVATRAEVHAAVEVVADARRSLASEGVPVPDEGAMQTGIMIEVPAAAVTAAILAPEVDFFSVGTNDLTQYTMAADRELSSVAALGDALHPAVLALIGRAASAAVGAGRWIGVCGELGADPVAVPLLLGLGVRELSVSTPAVGAVKEAVRATDLAKAAELARQALDLPSAQAVRDLVRDAASLG